MTGEVALLRVDWESGEGEVELGGLLDGAPPRFRRDVLKDWKQRIDMLLAEAEDALHPGRDAERLRAQRGHNGLRRRLCEQLAGQRIEAAEPLVNGDVLLHLQGERHVVLFARDEDVKLEVVADLAHARRYAARQVHGDYYLREEAVSDAQVPGTEPAVAPPCDGLAS